MGMHDGHRQRKKNQFRLTGLDSFADHEVLELLLFYAIPRQDTNPIAHRLLDRFGTLDGVFKASTSELEKVEGMGESAATLIKLLFPVCRRVRTSALENEVVLHDYSAIGGYFMNHFYGEKNEVFYMACLDPKGKLIRCVRLDDGAPNSVAVSTRKIVENAIETGACSVVLAHNHPSGHATPSPEDVSVTREVRRALEAISVNLLDHVVVAEDEYISMAESGLFYGRW